MITIVNTTAYDTVTSGSPFVLSAPTTVGNALIIAVSANIVACVFSSIQTNAGDAVQGLPFGSDLNASINISGGVDTTGIFWIPKGKGGATTMTINASGDFSVWVWEIQTTQPLVIDDQGVAFSTSATAPATGPTLNGSGVTDFYAACMTQGEGTLGAPWIQDATIFWGGSVFPFNFDGGHLLSSGAQTPVFAQTAFRWSVSGAAFKEATSPSQIIVTKRTNPVGSPQLFTFRPNWEGAFTLSDGQSNTSILAPGTYSISEDAVPGFTTTTNIDPTNIVLGPSQTINVIFTNSAIQPPCIPLDNSGVMVNGTFVPDLALFIGPSEALYTAPVQASAIKTFETLDEGRHAIVLDFNNSDGLYSRDLGTIFEWPVALHDVLFVWQPSIIPMPETIYGRASDWDDGGYTGDKFIQGITIEADSFGVQKTFQLQSSDDLTFHNLNEVPTTFVKQTLKSFSCDPFISHSVRIVSSDGIKWRVWGSKLVFEPLPSACMQWQTELVSLGMIGWAHAREMNIPYISNAPLALSLTFDTGATINLTIPNSGGKQLKTKVTLPANKFKLVSLRLLSTVPFRLFEGDLEMKVKPWGSGESYQVLRPFGGPSSPGATV